MSSPTDHRLRTLHAARDSASRLVETFDWSNTSLGPIAQWPASSWAHVSQLLRSPVPAILILGPERHILHNDAFSALFGASWSIGARLANAFPLLEPLLAKFEGRADRGEQSAASTGSALPGRSKAVAADLHWAAIEDEVGTNVGHSLQFVNVTFAEAADAFAAERAELQARIHDAAVSASSSDLRYRQILDSAVHFAVIATDIEGRVTFWNSGAEQMLGWSELHMLGQSSAAIFVAEDRAAGVPELEMESALRNGRASDIRWHLTQSGERFWANGEMTPLLDDRGRATGFVKILTDQTREHNAQQALLASEEQLRRAQDAGGVGLFTVDVVSSQLQVTPAFCRLFGLPVQSYMPAHMVERLVIDDDAGLVSDTGRRREGTAPLEVEYRIRRADTGEERTIARRAEYEKDRSGRIVRMAGAVQDITERRAVEQALRESEAQFRILAQAVPNQVWTADASGRLDWLNERVYDFAGLPRAGQVNYRWSDLVDTRDAESIEQRWREALQAGAVFEAEVRLRQAHGQPRWHLARAIPIRSDDGEIHRWVGTTTDIHHQKVALDQHALDRDRMWTMSQDLMLTCDYQGRIHAVNPSATRLLGWPTDELIGQAVSALVHPDDANKTQAELAKLAAGLTTHAFENRLRTRDGDYRLLDWTAVPDSDRIHAIGRDITDERAMARNQERIWNLSPVLKVIASADGQIQSINPAWTGVLGWAAQEVVDHPISGFVAPADAARATALLTKVAAGESVIEQELSLCTRAGETRPISWTFVPEYGTVYGFGRDLSEQRQTEDALRQSQKMEAVGQLTGGIAHDFNNLLQGITGSLDLMQRRLSQRRYEELDRFVTHAMNSARRASALTHRLLAFSRRQPLDPRAVDANALVASVEELLQRTLGEAIDLALDLQGELWLTRCDPNQLESALLNMVINARDAMPDGGNLVISTRNKHLGDHLFARTYGVAPGQYVYLTVTDSGVGMDVETAARAFEPFFTTKPMGHGTGLGLSMIYGFAKQSGGFATIDTELGEGTVVTVALPRYLGEMVNEAPALTLDDVQPSDRGAHVLVVEDEAVVRGLIIEVLRELKHTVYQAVDGPAGLAALQSAMPIDLLITDIGLPGLNGRQIADAGRAIRPGLKILLMTGYAETAAVGAELLEPGMSLITKPFPMEQLASQVQAMLNEEPPSSAQPSSDAD